ncbi:hypothetical protein MHU86_3758 [Fragilaria crotonensis]|nr:hypothetical protein MHU86_3758 [Fragilaria crotonensis]
MEDRIGIDFSSSGSVMSKKQLEEQRRKRGQCLSCGQQCFQKKLFKLIPLTSHGCVLEGRCLKCKPLDVTSTDVVLPAVSRPATRQDMERFTRSQSSLRLQGAGVNAPNSSSSSGGGGSASGRRGHSPTPGASYLQSTSGLGINSITRISEHGSGSGGGRHEDSTRSSRSADEYLDTSNRLSPTARNHQVLNRASSFTPELARGHDAGRDRTRTYAGSRGHSPAGTNSRGSTAGSFSQVSQQENSSRHATLARTTESRENGAPTPSVHAAILGGMAARRMVDNFRSRKAASLPLESAPPYVDQNSLKSDGAGSRERLSRTESIHSRDSRSWRTDEWKANDDDADQYPEPIHGILNRGGEFRFVEDEIPLESGAAAALPQFSTAHSESNRTMSSMSSIEEDGGGAGHRQKSWKPALEFSMKKRAADFVEDDGDDPSVASGADSNLLSSPYDRRALEEQRAIESLSAHSNDYREIVFVMREFEESPIVQQEALKHISNLHITDVEYTELLEIGTLNVVIAAMYNHINSPEVQSGACRAIWNLSATSENQVRLVEQGALDCILAAMDKYPADAELQEKALAALSNLGAAMENQNVILEKGAIDRVVEAMNRHSEDGPVQSKACSAFTNFASYDSPLKREIMRRGGGGAVVISMIMHPEDVDLQEKALRALRNICANSDENKIEVASVGGIDAVISAMQVHRDEPGVQEAGAWTLSNLAVNPDNKAFIGDSGGIDVVIRAMWVHSDCVGVQEWCCRALWTLSVDAQNRLVIMEVGGISAVVNAMQAHSDAATVQEKGCGVLSNLAATDDDSKMRIVEEEALDAIIMAMVLHADNRAVPRSCLFRAEAPCDWSQPEVHAVCQRRRTSETGGEKIPGQMSRQGKRHPGSLVVGIWLQMH